MIIKVTQHHIDNGERKSYTGCPIALAICEATKEVWMVFDVYLMDTIRNYIPLPQFMIDKIEKFDEHGTMKPFSFKLVNRHRFGKVTE